MTLVTLRAAQSKILKVWNNIDKRITKYHVEAADNAKFLGAIEKTSHSIYLEDPSELKGKSLIIIVNNASYPCYKLLLLNSRHSHVHK